MAHAIRNHIAIAFWSFAVACLMLVIGMLADLLVTESRIAYGVAIGLTVLSVGRLFDAHAAEQHHKRMMDLN